MTCSIFISDDLVFGLAGVPDFKVLFNTIAGILKHRDSCLNQAPLFTNTPETTS